MNYDLKYKSSPKQNKKGSSSSTTGDADKNSEEVSDSGWSGGET